MDAGRHHAQRKRIQIRRQLIEIQRDVLHIHAHPAAEAQRKGDFTPTAIQVAGPGEGCAEALLDMDEVDSIDLPPDQIDDMLELLNALS